MKIVLKIMSIFILLFIMSIAGESYSFRNGGVAQFNLLLNSLENTPELGQDHLGKKVIIVLGTSTSTISFNESNQKNDHFSYVDILKEKLKKNGDEFVVYNFSSYLLENKTLVESLLLHLEKIFPEIDYIVLENLRYTFPEDGLLNSFYFNFGSYCLRGFGGNEFYRDNCLLSIKHLGQDIKFSHGSGLCAKKYEKVLIDRARADFDGTIKRNNINGLIQCATMSHELNELLPSLSSNGPFQDDYFSYYNALVANHEDAEYFSDLFLVDHSTSNDKIFLNEFLDFSLKLLHLKKTQFIVVPSLLKSFSGLSELPVIKAYNERINVIYPIESIFAVKKERGLRYLDLFPDGHHYNVWIHDILSEEILKLLEKE